MKISVDMKYKFLICNRVLTLFAILGIHGPVKAFTKHLAPKVHDLFKNSLQPNAPIWRANWAVFNDLEGPLDLFTPDGHDKRNETNKTNDYQGNSYFHSNKYLTNKKRCIILKS